MKATSASIALDQFTTFGDLLKYLRRRAGLTQRELSIAVGYSDAQISRLEQNERLPDLATLTARFIPALHAEDQPEIAARLLELAVAVRREDAPAAGLSPYKGLYYFEESDAEIFFGRDELTQTLVDHINDAVKTDQRFLAVVGASGSGKSSVIRAGVIPALRWQQASSGWPVFVMTPTAHPLEMLASSLQGVTNQAYSSKKWIDHLIYQPKTLSKTLTDIAEETSTSHALLVVDQFEELFTLCRSEAEQASFVDNLLTAAFKQDGKAIIMIVLRADFYAHCARFNMLRNALAKHQEYIGSMTAQELRCAIEKPAQLGHWELEPGLVDLLLHDVGADSDEVPEPGALPLLSHALLTTWNRRRGRKLTISGYIASGGIRGAIAETAETVFQDQLLPEQRVIARQIFLRLTELGDETTSADTRRRVSFEELTTRPEDREQIHEVLMTLADARLITTNQNFVEVAHEALIREWPTLRNWIVENRESLRLHRHLTESAQEWESMGYDPGGTYRGARLAQALEWAEIHREDLNPLESDFLEASRTLANQEFAEREAQRQKALEAAQKLAEAERARTNQQIQSNRRLRQRAVILFIAFLIVGILALVAFTYGQRAAHAENLATSRELAAASGNNLQIDPERSVLLALHAIEIMDTLEARNALHQALPALHSVFTVAAHAGGAVDVVFSPDGTRIASIGDDGTAKIWDAVSGQQLQILVNNSGEFSSSVAFSPDGKILATSWFTQVILWDAYSGDKLYTISGGSSKTKEGYDLSVGQICFSPDGKLLAIANMEGVTKIWDVKTQTEVLSINHSDSPPIAITYNLDGSLLAIGGENGIVKILDAISGDEIYNLHIGGVIHAVAFSPNDPKLAAASEDGRVKIWNSDSGQELLSLPRLSGLWNIAFLSNDRIVTAGQDGVARVWDSVSGQEVLTLAGHKSTIVGVAGSPDGTRIATSGYDETVRVWDATPGHELLTILGHQDVVWDVQYSPDGKSLASVSVDGTAKLWDSESGKLLLTLPKGDVYMDNFTGLAFSHDGDQIATGGMDGIIKLWDSRTGDNLLSLEGHTYYVVGLAFSPDGTKLASASWDGTAKVWDLSTENEIVTFSGHPHPVILSSIAFSTDGSFVYTGADDHFIRVWDATTGIELGSFSGDGKDIYGIALNPDGDLLSMSNQDGEIILWDLISGEKLKTISGHTGLTLRIAFSRDGSQIASASFDRLAKVWNVDTGEEVASLYGNTSNVFGVSFSPDGHNLATAGADGTIRIYELQLDSLINLARSRITRSLTDDECRMYFHVDVCP
jgi:WD40 repeat protein/transcriptional regulator with XRE-family HTH domain